MMLQKRWNFGLGTVFSLIIIYFIYLYSKDKGWSVLAFLSKWYLIIISSLIALPLVIIFLVAVFSLLAVLAAMARMKFPAGKYKKKKTKDYVEAEYRVKE